MVFYTVRQGRRSIERNARGKERRKNHEAFLNKRPGFRTPKNKLKTNGEIFTSFNSSK